MDMETGEFEVLLTPTEWVKVHAPRKFLQLSVDPHTSWNLLFFFPRQNLEILNGTMKACMDVLFTHATNVSMLQQQHII